MGWKAESEHKNKKLRAKIWKQSKGRSKTEYIRLKQRTEHLKQSIEKLKPKEPNKNMTPKNWYEDAKTASKEKPKNQYILIWHKLLYPKLT